MATVEERKYESGHIVYRVVFNRKGIKRYSMTFDDYDVAWRYVELNEEEFYKNPEKYFKWREENYLRMRRRRYIVSNHIVRPKIRPRMYSAYVL